MVLSLPFSLPDATPIGDRYAMQTRDGITYYFFNLEPFDCHPADDRRAMLLRAAKLQVVSGVRQAAIMGAFNLSRPTLARAVKRYREHGEDAFFEPRRRRGRTVVDAQMAAKAAELLASGMSGSACARHLGIPPTTFNENRRAGVIAAPASALAAVADAPQVATDHPTSAKTEPAAATDRATRDARDKHSHVDSRADSRIISEQRAEEFPHSARVATSVNGKSGATGPCGREGGGQNGRSSSERCWWGATEDAAWSWRWSLSCCAA